MNPLVMAFRNNDFLETDGFHRHMDLIRKNDCLFLVVGFYIIILIRLNRMYVHT